MQFAKLKCGWCSREVLCNVDRPNTCPTCGHRCNIDTRLCDCPQCEKRRAPGPGGDVPDNVYTTRAEIRGVRAGRLVTSVNKDGVNRVVFDHDDETLTFEIFESTARALDVFKQVWQLLTADQKAKLLTALGVTPMD